VTLIAAIEVAGQVDSLLVDRPLDYTRYLICHDVGFARTPGMPCDTGLAVNSDTVQLSREGSCGSIGVLEAHDAEAGWMVKMDKVGDASGQVLAFRLAKGGGVEKMHCD